MSKCVISLQDNNYALPTHGVHIFKGRLSTGTVQSCLAWKDGVQLKYEAFE